MAALPENLALTDGFLRLREWRSDDAAQLQSVCGDPAVCPFTSVPWAYTLSAARQWIQRVHGLREAGTGLGLAITADEGGPALGNINLVRFNDARTEAALGYWLLPPARGRGLAAPAARLLCEWGFDHLGLRRIELAILPDNIASRRIAEKLGAQFEGLRLHEANGEAWDMMIYGLER